MVECCTAPLAPVTVIVYVVELLPGSAKPPLQPLSPVMHRPKNATAKSTVRARGQRFLLANKPKKGIASQKALVNQRAA